MALILPRRSLLSYPAGTAPGFDQTHPAGRGVGTSGVSANGTFISVLSGAKYTVNGTVTSTVKNGLGLVCTLPTSAGGDSLTITGSRGALPRTWAAIFSSTLSTATTKCVLTSGGSGSAGLYIAGASSFNLWDGTASTNFGPAAIADVPYFFAVSTDPGGGTNWVITNLTTGQLYSGNFANAHTPIWGTTSVGNVFGTGQEMQGSIAAAAISSSYLSLSELRAWAQDPWSLWYPPAPPAQRKVSYSYSYAPAGTTTTNGARVLQRFNRSKLAYPAGSVPGFDPAHPAAKGTVRFSGVSQNGGFINLLSGVVGTNANGPTCSIDGRLGESTGYAVAVSSAVATSWTGQAAVNDNNATIAAIVRFNTLNSFNAIFANNSGSGNAFALFQQGGFLMMRHGITNSVSTLGLVAGMPYFVAGSANGGASGSISYLVKRLDTGAVTSVNQTGTIAAVTSAGTYYVGNWGGLSLPTDGIIAAAAYTNAYMTPSELVAWSNDPWSFWYPNKMLNLTGDSGIVVTPPSIQYAAFSIPQHDGQSITQMMGY